jgi:uncharacterized protein (TIGR03067 family)
MRTRTLLLAVAIVSVNLGAAPPAMIDPAVKAEMKKLQGRWLHLRWETDKLTWNAREHAGQKITTISGNKWIYDHPDAKGSITAFDPEGHAFDLVTTFRGEVILHHEAIYKVDGDTLKVCLRKGKGDRPTGFERPTEKDTILYIFRRLKEE